MSFVDLFRVIEAEPLKAVAQHWNDARGVKRLPAWHDIQPSHMAGQLKFIWVYKYNNITKLFTGRLAGNVIEGVFGKSFRGTPMTELYPANGYEHFYARALRITCEPALFHGKGMVFHHLERIGLGERIMLPLADDGSQGDGILGATTYEMAGGTLSSAARENESWFSL